MPNDVQAPAPWGSYGEVFTREWVVQAILDLVGYTSDLDLTHQRIVEPSCGSGAFVIPIVERLLDAAARTSTPFEDLARCVRAYDLQHDHVDMARKRTLELLLLAGCPRATAESLVATWVRQADFLLDDEQLQADFAVGNPPYVRLESIPRSTLKRYRERWKTMKGRADLYVGFIERLVGMLNDGGRLGIICADRWMRNQYGESLRRKIADDCAVEAIWSMHDVDAFEEEVAAYPAITVLRRGRQGAVAIAETTAGFGPASAGRLVRWSKDRTPTLQGTGFRAYRPAEWVTGGQPWPAGSVERLKLLDHLRQTFPPLEDEETGTRIGIGIATGADQVYLTSRSEVVEPERIIPLATTADIRTGTFAWTGTYLINPWENRQLVELNRFPKLRRHFARFEKRLRGRHTVRKAGTDCWYKTIDTLRPGLLERPKLLIQDLKSSLQPVLESGGHYPHHNLYYVTSDTWDLEVLGGLLLSGVAQAFIEAYCVRMRGDTLRFQAQYLRLIRVPQQHDLPAALQQTLRSAFRTRDVETATAAALHAYGLQSLPD